MLKRVTLTGADDSVEPDQLAVLSADFPFVEWGILAHQATNRLPPHEWAPRWPSRDWIINLQSIVKNDSPLHLSLHLCGHWVRELLLGRDHVPPQLYDQFQRVQLNFHAENTPCDKAAFYNALAAIPGKRSWIFQIDESGGNEHMSSLWEEIDRVEGRHLDTVPLFDVSGGAGIVPDEWPKPYYMLTDEDYVLHGYAGGLGPDNVLAELNRIKAVAGRCNIWIDMETKIRSKSDSVFDLNKCRSVLEQVAPFIEG